MIRATTTSQVSNVAQLLFCWLNRTACVMIFPLHPTVTPRSISSWDPASHPTWILTFLCCLNSVCVTPGQLMGKITMTTTKRGRMMSRHIYSYNWWLLHQTPFISGEHLVPSPGVSLSHSLFLLSFSFSLRLNAKSSECWYSDLCPVISSPGISPHPPCLPYSFPVLSSLSRISFLLKGHGIAHKLKWDFKRAHCHFLPKRDTADFPSLLMLMSICWLAGTLTVDVCHCPHCWEKAELVNGDSALPGTKKKGFTPTDTVAYLLPPALHLLRGLQFGDKVVW